MAYLVFLFYLQSLLSPWLPWWLSGKKKNLPANVGDADSTLDWEDPLEEEMAIHSSILAWEISRTEVPGWL